MRYGKDYDRNFFERTADRVGGWFDGGDDRGYERDFRGRGAAGGMRRPYDREWRGRETPRSRGYDGIHVAPRRGYSRGGGPGLQPYDREYHGGGGPGHHPYDREYHGGRGYGRADRYGRGPMRRPMAGRGPRHPRGAPMPPPGADYAMRGAMGWEPYWSYGMRGFGRRNVGGMEMGNYFTGYNTDTGG